jgi:nitroreductase
VKAFDSIVSERRSIRKYKDVKPEESLIRQMLQCACYAPSPSHSQPVRYILLESDSLRQEIWQAMKDGRDRFLERQAALGASKKVANVINAYFRFSEFMFGAPYLFAVGTESYTSFSRRMVEAGILSEDHKGYTDADITTGLSLSLFIHKGVELGISTCILTAPFVYIPDLSRRINPNLRITCFVSAGFADEAPPHLERISVEDLCLRM